MGMLLDMLFPPSMDMLVSTTLARGPLIPMLMPTPLDRLLLDFPMPMLLPLDMPTTLDTLPTPLTLLAMSTTPMLPTMFPLSAMLIMVLTMVKQLSFDGRIQN